MNIQTTIIQDISSIIKSRKEQYINNPCPKLLNKLRRGKTLIKWLSDTGSILSPLNMNRS